MMIGSVTEDGKSNMNHCKQIGATQSFKRLFLFLFDLSFLKTNDNTDNNDNNCNNNNNNNDNNDNNDDNDNPRRSNI